MVSFPPCKINLGLRILRKRPDGFHDIETCFYPVPWNDILEIIPAKKFQFSASGIPISGDANSNLCVKAYQLLKADFRTDAVQIHLHKVIPMGAGLGGGSADAAWALRGLNEIFSLGLSTEKLMDYASKLGSDCPFFVQDKVMMGTERGQVLKPCTVDLKGKFLVIVKPDVHIATAEAYAGVHPSETGAGLQSVLEIHDLRDWKGKVKNDFEESVFSKSPVIKSVKENLYDAGAIYASMSGSGSAVFGVFDAPVRLERKFEGMHYFAATL